ncbi:hypothetical protein CCACVL1_29029 [Corchorus capsularis]|uniref:Uncharacterized protein n=1 Tax=Corchorus capsularis TaxID=210143 RepID=A0A1R3G461_COCAP|nr:hypothetical protein CCACVL1_29029 [Corchorus capsularis]
MAFSNWICTNSTKNMFVKVVHPGGHVELHDRPVLAAEIICRNPRCVVAHPNVFQQPSAIVAPETLLMPGQKFYVVPISTIRKLQRLSNKYSPSPVRQQTPTPTTSKSQSCEEHDLHDNRTSSSSSGGPYGSYKFEPWANIGVGVMSARGIKNLVQPWTSLRTPVPEMTCMEEG